MSSHKIKNTIKNGGFKNKNPSKHNINICFKHLQAPIKSNYSDIKQIFLFLHSRRLKDIWRHLFSLPSSVIYVILILMQINVTHFESLKKYYSEK